MKNSPHSFHIPVMGTGFTMDSPLRVARYGIDSVVSLGDDILMEKMRRHYCQAAGLPFEPIENGSEDNRARRITAWLNFMDDQIRAQSLSLQLSPIHPGSELWRYYSLLPDGPLKSSWQRMLSLAEGPDKWDLEASLRLKAVPGHIDVNVMTKVDRAFKANGEPLPDGTDALTGLRGFAKSRLDATVVFSAGMNPRLYGSLTAFDDFFPDKKGFIKKRVCLKVSDYRSAEIQGRFLAKKGIWVSEFRFESGLNCGGHAFAPQGQLFGPILEEFSSKRSALRDELFMIWSQALASRRSGPFPDEPPVRFSVQGGVGRAAEQRLLIERYRADSVGWGTPFLLVPEATAVDAEHRKKLCEAGEADVELSDASPLGIPFWSLKTSSSEALRLRRIAEGHPGSPCGQAYLTFDTEFGPNPLCSSSRAYQKKKIEALEALGLPPQQLEAAKAVVLGHACICVDLGGGAANALGIKEQAAVAVCPGPNIAWFDREASLEEMVGHIYGRNSLLSEKSSVERPHMFLTELKLSVDFMAREMRRTALGLSPRASRYFEEYRKNLEDGIRYYLRQGQGLFGGKDAWLQQKLTSMMTPAGASLS